MATVQRASNRVPRGSLDTEEIVIAVCARTVKIFDGACAEKKFTLEAKPVLKQCILLSSQTFLRSRFLTSSLVGATHSGIAVRPSTLAPPYCTETSESVLFANRGRVVEKLACFSRPYSLKPNAGAYLDPARTQLVYLISGQGVPNDRGPDARRNILIPHECTFRFHLKRWDVILSKRAEVWTQTRPRRLMGVFSLYGSDLAQSRRGHSLNLKSLKGRRFRTLVSKIVVCKRKEIDWQKQQPGRCRLCVKFSGVVGGIDSELVVQNNTEKRAMHLQFTVVVNEAQFSESVHEEIHS